MSMDRSLRPLMARPLCSNGCTFCTTSSPTQYCSSLHNPRLTSWTQQPSSDYGGGSKREMKSLVSSRWNPTPEQVQALEDMFRRGTRTPSAEQIQQIAAKLRRFGKIEGKNVFYWFQNHKARDRQKKRRQLDLLPGKKHISTKNAPNQPAGLSTKNLEIEHAKKVPRMSKCGTASKYLGGEVDECKRDGWTQLDLSSCMPPSVSMHKTSGQENAHPFVALKMLTPKTDDFEENRTLELFPVRSSGCSTKDKELNVDASSAETKLVPNQFFEFLPSKN